MCVWSGRADDAGRVHDSFESGIFNHFFAHPSAFQPTPRRGGRIIGVNDVTRETTARGKPVALQRTF
jgi:hypothetical protein